MKPLTKEEKLEMLVDAKFMLSEVVEMLAPLAREDASFNVYLFATLETALDGRHNRFDQNLTEMVEDQEHEG